MNILPRILYPLQMLPNSLPSYIFKDLHRSISNFIWNRKRHKIRLDKLQLPIQEGGLSVPNIQYYHWAIQLKNVSEWVTQDQNSIYLDLDSLGHDPLILSGVPFFETVNHIPDIQHNYILNNIFNSLKSIKKAFSGNKKYSHFAPIYNNPYFIPSCSDSGFKEWRTAGIVTINDMYEGDTIKSFQQLQEEYNLSKSHFFRYLQIRSFLNSIQDYKIKHQPQELEKIILHIGKIKKKKINYTYYKLTALKNVSTEGSKMSWEKDLKVHITDQQWRTILINTKKICQNYKVHETQFKIVHKLQTTPYIRNKYDKQCSGLCKKCKQQIGTYEHLIWSCPEIQSFWVEIGNIVSAIVKCPFELNPLQCILGLPDPSTNLTKYKRLLNILWYCARLTILQQWLEELKPNISNWLNNVLQFFPLERLTYTLKGNTDYFFEVWSPFIDYTGQDQANILLRGFANVKCD